ncbi:MAG: hypothetical protein ACI4F4_03225 [Lachnospiraceae bacterium]
MGLKVFKGPESNQSEDYLTGHNFTSQNQKVEEIPERDEFPQPSCFYEKPKLIRKNGVYYIGYLQDIIPIEEWEAKELFENPKLVYDVIVSHRRKYYFNTAEDTFRG